MKRLFLFAAVAGFTLISAHPPQDRDRGPHHDEDAYPPCSRTVRDSCIQRHERGGRRHHRGHDGAMAHRGGHVAHARMASRCAVRCASRHRVMAARVRRAGERG